MARLTDSVNVSGMAALGDKLDKLPLEMKENIARKAIMRSGQIGLASVQQETPIRTGNLFHHIRMARRTRNVEYTQIQYVVFVKTGGGKRGKQRNYGQDLPYYWYFIEFGWTDRSGKHHEGNPFMLRGFERSAGNAATQARDVAAYWVQRWAK